jgi:hypothetical protein
MRESVFEFLVPSYPYTSSTRVREMKIAPNWLISGQKGSYPFFRDFWTLGYEHFGTSGTSISGGKQAWQEPALFCPPPSVTTVCRQCGRGWRWRLPAKAAKFWTP